MKGVLQASAFYLMLLGISAGLMLLISLQHMRSQSLTILKQALQESAQVLKTIPIYDRERQLEFILKEAFSVRKPNHESYVIEVKGFIADPIALKVSLIVSPDYIGNNRSYQFEESLIEVNP